MKTLITPKEAKKPVTLRLPRSIHRNLRLAAATEDRTIESLVSEALTQYLSGERR